jgi:hypothetical protein
LKVCETAVKITGKTAFVKDPTKNPQRPRRQAFHRIARRRERVCPVRSCCVFQNSETNREGHRSEAETSRRKLAFGEKAAGCNFQFVIFPEPQIQKIPGSDWEPVAGYEPPVPPGLSANEGSVSSTGIRCTALFKDTMAEPLRKTILKWTERDSGWSCSIHNRQASILSGKQPPGCVAPYLLSSA